MMNKLVKCGKLSISNTSRFTLIAGPCQLESENHALKVAEKLKNISGTEFRKFITKKKLYKHADKKMQKILFKI